MFEKFRQLHIDEPGRNWYNSLWRVLRAYHDLPGPTGLPPHLSCSYGIECHALSRG